MPRIPPLPPGEWPPEMNEALAALRPAHPRHPFPSAAEGRPKGLNLLGTLARHPELARAFNTFNGYILFASTLTAPPTGAAGPPGGHRPRSAYEWEQHAVLAADAGLDPGRSRADRPGPRRPRLVPSRRRPCSGRSTS